MFDDNEDLGSVYSDQTLNKTGNLLANMKDITSLPKKTTKFSVDNNYKTL